MNKKLLHKNIMESLSKTLGKTLNEGAGAGYNITIKGLTATNIEVLGKETKENDEIIKFHAELQPGQVEWEAQDYYNGFDSTGIFYDGMQVDEIDDEQRQVDGGEIYGYVYLDDVFGYSNGYTDSEEEDVTNYIEEHLDDFEFKTMYGRGWIHVNLDDPMEFENIEVSYQNRGYECVFIDKIIINAPEITSVINWFFENKDNFEEIYGLNNDLDESIKSKKAKHINESFTMDRELQSILRKFRVFIDMDRFGEIAYNEELDELEPGLQRIISIYDPYVEEIIGELQIPNSDIAYNHIVSMAEDNEWENGTEANMVVDFLEELYTWCLKHGLEKPTLRESAKIKTKKKSVTEDLTKADKEDAESKMDKWHEGKRKQNVKACSTDKLIMNLGICKRKGYDSEAQQLQDELDSRGINESQLFEGEELNIREKYGDEFADLVGDVDDGARKINTEKDSEILFDALVPSNGHADSLGGELLRAAERIAYRYFNDGDMAGERYGRETVNPAVRYMEFAVRPTTSPLYGIVKDFYRFVERSYVDVSDKEYEFMVMRLLRLTIIHIIQNRLWNVPNQNDMFDFRDPKVDVDRGDDYDDDGYWGDDRW